MRRRIVAWCDSKMKEWGWTQADLARECDVDPGNLNRLLKDGGPLGFDMFMLLCWGLKIPPNTMTGEDPTKG